MIYKFLYFLFKTFPKLKRFFWKKWYTALAKKIDDPDLKFMNYGFFKEGFTPKLSKNDELERYPIQLYHHLVSKTDVSGKELLEIGSGRGGGSDYITRIFNPLKVTGIDISTSAVSLCNKIYKKNNLKFLEGDAENLPFIDNSYDIVLNVESSHCYGDINKFFSEVKRVLKSNGIFLLTDFRDANKLDDLISSLKKHGFELISKEDITDNIVKALKLMTNKRINEIDINIPSFLRKYFKSFAGVEGSSVYNSFYNRHYTYFTLVLKNIK